MSEPEDAANPEPTLQQQEQAQERLEEQLASSLMLAGEIVSGKQNSEPVVYATPEDDWDAPILPNFAFLTPILEQIRTAIVAEPKLAELLRLLPQGLGAGEILQVLFANTFPEQRNRHKVYLGKRGEHLLTDKQIEALRQIALGMTYDQLATDWKCSYANISQIMKRVKDKLNASTDQEASAVAISMGYLRMDVLDFVHASANVASKDYSVLDSHICYLGGVEQSANPVSHQQMSAFGLMLMLATGEGILTELDVVPPPSDGVLYRLDKEGNGTYQARCAVDLGRLRRPRGIAIAPPSAQDKGFTAGNVFVMHQRTERIGRNVNEIAEFTPDGEFVRAFIGGATYRTGLYHAVGLAFEASGALLATTSDVLLRFTQGGQQVGRVVPWFSPDVCTDKRGHIYLVHGSTRGDAIGVYSARGKLLCTFAQQKPNMTLPGVKVLSDGKVLALTWAEKMPAMEVYDEKGERLDWWRVPGASRGTFALNTRTKQLFIAHPDSRDIGVYSFDGKEETRIALDGQVVPRTITLAPDGTLWCIGSLPVA